MGAIVDFSLINSMDETRKGAAIGVVSFAVVFLVILTHFSLKELNVWKSKPSELNLSNSIMSAKIENNIVVLEIFSQYIKEIVNLKQKFDIKWRNLRIIQRIFLIYVFVLIITVASIISIFSGGS